MGVTWVSSHSKRDNPPSVHTDACTHKQLRTRITKPLQFLSFKQNAVQHYSPQTSALPTGSTRDDPQLRQLPAAAGWVCLPTWHMQGPYRGDLSPSISEVLWALQQDFPDVKLMLRKQTEVEKAFITRLICVPVQLCGQAKIGNGA